MASVHERWIATRALQGAGIAFSSLESRTLDPPDCEARTDIGLFGVEVTELVDEAFIRLVKVETPAWEDRAHFYGAAARVTRQILVDHARRRARVKRDHGIQVTLDDQVSDEGVSALDLVALDTALQELEQLAPRQGRVVELRYFAGLDIDQTAEVLGISRATVKRDWAFARAFLLQALSTPS